MKIRILILVLILTVSILSSCVLPETHTHNFAVDYANDETHHWHACECGEKNDYAEHNWNEGEITLHPTVDTEGVKTFTCTVCQFQRTETLAKLESDHTHTFDTSYSDEYTHGFECVCGERNEETAHVWDDGVVTTPAGEIETGIMTFTCADCGHKSTQNIPSTKANGLSFLKSTHYRMKDKLSATPLTLEAEIYVPASFTGRAGAIFSNYLGVRQDWHFEIYNNGVPRFYYHDAAGNVKDIMFNNVDVRGDWKHIALTFDYSEGIIILYLNGEIAEIALCDIDLAPDITMYQFFVGGDNRSDNGVYFQGQIRSIAAYSDVRTADEIKHSAQHGTNFYADDLLVAYLLNENSGGKDINDLSGNGYKIYQEWLDSNEVEIDYAFSFAVVGDTQWLSKYRPEKMEGIYDWILENAESKKIAHVMGLGDITEDWNTANKEQEWIRAHEYISKLNGVVPYSLVRGNHDESKYFFKYFATEAYMDQFGGYYMVEGDIRNAYKTFKAGDVDYLLMVLDFGPSDEMLAWANEVVLAHPNHKVIVTTHGYQAFNGDRINFENVTSYGGTASQNDVDTSVGNNFRGYNNGDQVWDKFISKHPNIFLVLSGHTSMEDVFVLQTEGNHGNIVNQMVIDPQWMDPQKDGVGMVCMLYFTADGNTMEVEWLSTDTGKYYKEYNQYQLDLTNSLNAPAHDFHDSYNEKYHNKACDCGYTYNNQPHVFDGGVLNADGFMVYSCACGYQRIASATNDPIALELQALLEKYYNDSVYYRETVQGTNALTTYFNADKFWTTDADDYELTSSYVTLRDIILGKHGDIKLDMGWNYLEGLYSSANSDTVKGMAMFALGSKDVSNSGVTRVTVEANGELLIIKLFAGDDLVAGVTVGAYATTTLVTHAGETLQVLYTKVNVEGMVEIVTPKFDGLVAEYDKIILDAKHSALEKTVYYSTIAVWDGSSVSTNLKGSGTEEDPFLIESGADLAYVRNVINASAAQTPNFSSKYFKMTQSIDLNGYDFYMGIGTPWASRKGFHGFFDGNHCTIRGLDSSNSLFGTIEGGWLKDLSVYGEVNGTTTVGGVVGYVANTGKLINVTNYANVNGENTLGGVVANAENNASDVINCVNYGKVTGSSWNIGGIAGSGGHNITDCVNYGDVHSSGSDNVGGIAGTTKNTGTISDCYNYGNISTVHGRTGGIVGWLNKPVINCVNYGSVTAGWDSGGVVGFVNEGQSASIVDCVNYGTVNGDTGIGGIFGFNHANAGTITITGCVNNGTVTGTWGVGGIAGNTKAEISNCVNYGTLNAKGELGGIIGKCYGKVTECTNRGVVNGSQDIIGGIVGHLHDTTYIDIINTTNYQEGTVIGPNSKDIIGK